MSVRDPSGGRWNCGWECCPVILSKWKLPRQLGILSTTWAVTPPPIQYNIQKFSMQLNADTHKPEDSGVLECGAASLSGQFLMYFWNVIHHSPSYSITSQKNGILNHTIVKTTKLANIKSSDAAHHTTPNPINPKVTYIWLSFQFLIF